MAREEERGAKIESRIIDVARALAILLVLLVHTWVYVLAPVVSPVSARLTGLFALTGFGASGVGLFFVISGYLLNLLYAGDRFAARAYWVRRFGRIYPAWLFWTAVAVAAAVLAALLGSSTPFYGASVIPDSHLNILLLMLHLAFLGFLVPGIWNSVIPGGWSIQAEMANYALYPLIRSSRFWVVLIVVLGVEIVQFALFSFPNAVSVSPDWTRIVSTYLTSPVWFVLGIFLSRVVAAVRRPALRAELPLEGSLVGVVLAFAVVTGLSGPFVSQATTLAVVLGAIASAYLIVRFEWWRPFAAVGRYSYGIYFAHLLFLGPLAAGAAWLAAWSGPDALKLLTIPVFVIAYAVLLGLSFVAARLVFELVERRPIEWARRFPARLSRR